MDKFDQGDRISDYFSGVLLLNENQYGKSFEFLKKLNGLETRHTNYSVKYLYSLVNEYPNEYLIVKLVEYNNMNQ